MKQKAAKPTRKALLALGALLVSLALFAGLLPLAALAETEPEPPAYTEEANTLEQTPPGEETGGLAQEPEPPVAPPEEPEPGAEPKQEPEPETEPEPEPAAQTAAGAPLPVGMAMPAGAVAASPFTVYDAVYDIADGDVIISNSGIYLIKGNGVPQGNSIRVTAGVNASITLQDVVIDLDGLLPPNCAFEIEAGANVNLTLVGSNTLKSGWGAAGLQVSLGASLTIDGPGTLMATGGERSAGIGGSYYADCGNITINGGVITAIGSSLATGLGGTELITIGSTLTINGGTITAGSYDGNAISSLNILFNGGNIYAKSGPVEGYFGLTNNLGEDVYLIEITLEGAADATCVTGISLPGTNIYGRKDVYTIGDKLYFWLPAPASGQAMVNTADGLYTGAIEVNTNNDNAATLRLPTTTLAVEDITFTSEEEGYQAPAARPLPIENPGPHPVTITGVSLTGGQASAFTLTGAGGDVPLDVGESSTGWAIAPVEGLPIGTYAAQVEVSYTASGRPLTATANVSFTVLPRTQATVRFDANGGAPAPGPQTVTLGEPATKPDEPVKSGYLFLGWFEAGSEDAWDFATPVTDDVTLTARWAEYFTLSFNAAGGTPTPQSQQVAVGFAPKAVEAPERTGHTFLGWQQEDGSYWVLGGASPTLMPGEDTELTAAWRVITYNIVYHLNDDSGRTEGGSAAYGSLLEMPDSPTRPGHTFTGWATVDKEGWDFAKNTMPPRDLALYAQWEKDKEEETSRPEENSGGGGGETPGSSSSTPSRTRSSSVVSSPSSSQVSSAVSAQSSSSVLAPPAPATEEPQDSSPTDEPAEAPQATGRARIVVDQEGGYGEPGEPDYIQPNGIVRVFGNEIPQGGFSSIGGWSLVSLMLALLSLLTAVVTAAHTLAKQRQAGAAKPAWPKWAAAAMGLLPLAVFLLAENLQGIPIVFSKYTPFALLLCLVHIAALAAAVLWRKRKITNK